MKICRYQIKNSPSTQPRLGIIDENGDVVDPSLAYAIELERMAYNNPFERAEHHIPSSLFKLLNLTQEPLNRLREGLGMVEFLDILEHPKSNSGIRYRYQINEVNLLCPTDHIPVYRDFYAHEKHVKKGFEKRNEPVPKKNGMKSPPITKGTQIHFTDLKKKLSGLFIPTSLIMN